MPAATPAPTGPQPRTSAKKECSDWAAASLIVCTAATALSHRSQPGCADRMSVIVGHLPGAVSVLRRPSLSVGCVLFGENPSSS